MNKKYKRRYKNVKFKKEYDILDLYKAYWDCRKSKRSTLAAIEFEYDLESNMLHLYEDLKSGNYKIGESICFVVLKPKPREVWAASFRDRIVHHFVYNIIKDRFLNSFIKDTFSCIPERGTLMAAKQASKYAKSITSDYKENAYYLKADIKNFFVTIDKNILFELVIKRVPEKWLQKIIKQIIFNDPKEHALIQSPQWKFDLLPSYKSLWNAPPLKGLPIGNLTSQFFSNIYLDVMDKFIKHKLKCRYYLRYVDDFLIYDKSPENLNVFHKEIGDFLRKELKLELHQDKKTINLIKNGVDFVGYKIKPGRMYLRQRTLRKMFNITERFQRNIFDVKEKTLERLFCVFNSYLGQLGCVKGFRLRKKLCEKISYPYFCHNEDYSKVRKMYLNETLMEYAKLQNP